MVDEAAVKESEEYRSQALACIERARQRQADGDPDGEHAEVQKSWQCLEKSLALYPSNHRTRILLVSCAISGEDYERARVEALLIYEDLDVEQLRSMQDSVLHLSIAHAAKMLGKVEEAQQFATEAIELYPWDPQPYSILGEMFESMGRFEEAEQKCREALERDKDPACEHHLRDRNLYFSLCCLGSSLLHMGKPAEAEPYLKEAQQVDSSEALAPRLLSQVYLAQGQEEQAKQFQEYASQLESAGGCQSARGSAASGVHQSLRTSNRHTPPGSQSGGARARRSESPRSGKQSLRGPGSIRSGRSMNSRSRRALETENTDGVDTTVVTSKNQENPRNSKKDESGGGCFMCCMDR